MLTSHFQRIRSSLLVINITILGVLGVAMPLESMAAPCVGSNSGKSGTCSSISKCSGTTEPATGAACDGSVCCIPSDSGSGEEKPPFIPPVQPPEDDQSRGGAGTQCTVFSNSGIFPRGTCQSSSACTGKNLGPSSDCNNSLICCDARPANVGDNCIGGEDPGSQLGYWMGTCQLTSQCSGKSTESGACTGGTVCCARSNGGPTGPPTPAPGEGSQCRPSTQCKSKCESTEDGLIGLCPIAENLCCVPKGSGTGTNPGSGTGTTGAGSLTCPTNFEPIAGVCFPKRTGLSDKSVIDIIATLLAWLLAIFGFIALLGFIISGLQYLLSAGNENMAETAKRNMKYSIIGILVALSGFIIIQAIDTLLKAQPWI